MLITIDDLLLPDEVTTFRQALTGGDWEDGRLTAGTLGAHAKQNEQLADESATARSLANELLARLGRNAAFVSAAMPEKIFPPRFARYGEGQSYDTHVDGAVMAIPGTDRVLRSDLSATVFLSDPGSYSGGELVIESEFGAQEVKLPAGSMVVYPSSSLHRVAPVTSGERVVALIWLQSMVPDQAARSLLFELDQSIQALTPRLGPRDQELLRLTGVYHNLVRRWAEI